MRRINIYTEGGQLDGWFDLDKALVIDEAKDWDGNNMRGRCSGGQIGYEQLIRTTQGRWVLHSNFRSEFDGPETWTAIDAETAEKWLARNGSDALLEQHFGPQPDERVWGRPPVGPTAKVKLPEDVMALADADAAAAGMTRSGWLRKLVTDHYAGRQADPEPAPTHHTAWIAVTADVLNQPMCDITVVEDALAGEREDRNGDLVPDWTSTGGQAFYAITSTPAAGDHDGVVAEATQILAAAGWTVTETWEATGTGYAAVVTRD